MPPAASSPPAGRSLQIELFTPSWIQYLAHLYQPDIDAKAAPRAPTAAPPLTDLCFTRVGKNILAVVHLPGQHFKFNLEREH